jgi:hypothetical protein
MAINTLQAPRAVVMIRPHGFFPNAETAADNLFQKSTNAAPAEIAAQARAEHDDSVARLRAAGITVHVFEDDGSRDTPDSVFPNNWFSTHPGGQVAIYPMFTPNRRRERRTDVIDLLKTSYRVETVFDYSGLESDNLILEGTGAMVLDHIGRMAFTARSNRADAIVLERFCTHHAYEPITFDAVSADGTPVYHTNVVMCVATDFALVSLPMIRDAERRATITRRLRDSGREVIELSAKQIDGFAGNAIELTGGDRRYLVLSQTALDSLTAAQVAVIERSASLLPIAVPTIELAGGSARCMIAGVHLTPRFDQR